MFYQKLIRELLNGADYEPRHIEALMRLQYSTLDHLTRDDFRREVRLCTQCIDEMGKDGAEKNAKSMGL